MEKNKASKLMEVTLYRATSNYPALINIFGTMKVVYTDIIPTMGIDKFNRLAVNAMWIVNNQQYMMGLLLHECLHSFFQHHLIEEKYGYDQEKFNVAGDLHINNIIDTEGLELPDGVLRHTNFKLPPQLCAEEYYHLLKGNPKGERDMLNDQNTLDELDKLAPDHLTTEELNEQVQECYHKLAEGMRAGSMTSTLTDFAREQLKPKVNWKTILQNRVRSCETTVYKLREKDNYKRPSRRTRWEGGVILPKKAGKQLSLVMSFDTSGSITPELLNQFLSEVRGALQYSDVKRCFLWSDTVYWEGSEQELLSNIEKIYQMGGTEGDCMRQVGESIKSDIYVHFTDGYLDYPTGLKGTHLAIVWGNDEIKEIRSIK